MSSGRIDGYERTNRSFWDADADAYQAAHAETLRGRTWGVWDVAEDDVGAIGAVAGLDVLELGCGAAQWAIALAADGGRVVALDQSRAQLAHARDAVASSGLPVTLVCASAVSTPFTDRSFDLVMCDHGAMSFCDPYATVPEVARLLRPNGRLVFSQATPWYYLTWDEARERVSRRLHRPYFGIRAFDSGEGTVDFQLGYGEWIRLFGTHGFVVDDLVELRAPRHARTTFGDFDARWARRWPAEQIWKVRLATRI